MELSGRVAIVRNGAVVEVRDLGDTPVSVKVGEAYPFSEVYPDLADGEELAGYSDNIGRNAVVRTWGKVPAARRKIRKSIVQQRLIDAGKMEAAYVALTSNAAYFARWFAPDRSEVYADDPDALALLQAIGANAETIMAPDDMKD